MYIQNTIPTYTSKIMPKNQISFGEHIPKPQIKPHTNDTFTHAAIDIKHIINTVTLESVINQGLKKIVYETNYPDFVIGLTNGIKFCSGKLEPFDDPNGLVVAQDECGLIQLMKYIKGEPLYGKGWRLLAHETKDDYINTFNKILNLPDESFSEYIRNVVKIRQNGYNIDTLNPNNFLLNGTHIGIVDLTEEETSYLLQLQDFDAFIDEQHLLHLLKQMDDGEIQDLADKIKRFYDRIMEIAAKEGYDLSVPNTDNFFQQEYLYDNPSVQIIKDNLPYFLYNKDYVAIDYIINSTLYYSNIC